LIQDDYWRAANLQRARVERHGEQCAPVHIEEMATRDVPAIGTASHQDFLASVSQRHDLDGGVIEAGVDHAGKPSISSEKHRLGSRQDLRPAVSEIAAFAVDFDECGSAAIG
jgi:hypothetical protein